LRPALPRHRPPTAHHDRANGRTRHPDATARIRTSTSRQNVNAPGGAPALPGVDPQPGRGPEKPGFLRMARVLGLGKAPVNAKELSRNSSRIGPMTVHGSCLCGTVRYEVRQPFDKFLYCHCSRCRKATGTAHAANAVVAPEAFRWTAGEDNVVRYDLSTARSFATAFCKTCGSPMPHLTRSGLRVI